MTGASPDPFPFCYLNPDAIGAENLTPAHACPEQSQTGKPRNESHIARAAFIIQLTGRGFCTTITVWSNFVCPFYPLADYSFKNTFYDEQQVGGVCSYLPT